ncbi:hypothetical protein IW261DRAFT_1573781 [Armillaria novae-zelandiae]|uniref:Uncharacterized protein n=1 Tax=Armillaria novae-zelandiae TaxID=153914 RepID=A0AA39U120_9AGAR|nr:hypothetical protein IW261DRAFT_1573781 [Armillaria novae-zelandiae]
MVAVQDARHDSEHDIEVVADGHREGGAAICSRILKGGHLMWIPTLQNFKSPIPLSFYNLQNWSKMYSLRRLAIQLCETVKRVCGIVRRSLGNSGLDNDLAPTSNVFPPSYEAATSAPPPYAAIDMLVYNDIHVGDTIQPAPLYNDQYTPLEDVGMAGFTRSQLTTVFKEDVDQAVE